MSIGILKILFDDLFLYDDKNITFDGIKVVETSEGGTPKKRKFRSRRFIVDKINVAGIVSFKFKTLYNIRGIKKFLLDRKSVV